MANIVNILVYRSTISNLDFAREKIITELSKKGIKVNHSKTDDIVTVYRTANECIKIWFVSYRSSEKYASFENILSLRPVQFNYYNIGYSQDSNVDIIIKHGAFGTELWRLHHVINTIVDFAVDQKDRGRRYDDIFPLTQAKKIAINSTYGLMGATFGNPYDFQKCIKDVIHDDPATIVFWTDGTKTVVKVDGEEYDPEKGLAMAFSKKMFGNKGNYYNVFKKWLPDEHHEFKVGYKVKLKKEIYGFPVGTIGIIVEPDSLKPEKDNCIVHFQRVGNFCINIKYLRSV